MSNEAHMTEMEIASFLGHTLDASERDRIEDHLAQCDECRASVLVTHRVVRHSSKSRKTIVALPLLIAAGITIVLVTSRRQEDALVTRDHSARAAIASYPTRQGPNGLPLFSWQSLSMADHYEFVLSTADGHRVFSASTIDTTVVLPASVQTSPDIDYVWYADAFMADGSRVSTPPQTLTIRR